jgi:hypothetical protein
VIFKVLEEAAFTHSLSGPILGRLPDCQRAGFGNAKKSLEEET